MDKSFIYLIESVDNFETIYKIGYTKNKPSLRVKQLQTGTGSDLKLICEYQTEFGTKLENVLHYYYGDKRVRNEWFRLDLEDIIDFERTCKMLENNMRLLVESENYHFEKYMRKK